MIKEAKEKGIDLTDPRVVQMLTQMKEEKKAKASGEGGGAEAVGKKYQQETRSKLAEMVGDMPSAELERALVDMEVDFEEGSSNEAMKEKFIQALMDGKQIPDSLRNSTDVSSRSWWMNALVTVFGGGNTSVLGNVRVAAIFVLLTIGWRLLSNRGGGYELKERLEVVEVGGGMYGGGGSSVDDEF